MLAFSCYGDLFWSKHMISILREQVKVGIKLNGKGDFAAFWAGLATDIALLVGQGSQQTSAKNVWKECLFWDLQANNHEVGHENGSIQDKNWSKEKWIVRFVRSDVMPTVSKDWWAQANVFQGCYIAFLILRKVYPLMYQGNQEQICKST